jgi:predicted amidohydrolase
MTMNGTETAYDLVLTGARICDSATGLDRHCDLAVNGDRIAAVGSGLASHARQVIALDGKLVTAG